MISYMGFQNTISHTIKFNFPVAIEMREILNKINTYFFSMLFLLMRIAGLLTNEKYTAYEKYKCI